MSRTIIHIGAGKCGSSALQRSLTRQPRWRSKSGERFEYLAFNAAGDLVTDHAPAELRVHRYSASVPLSRLDEPGRVADKIRAARRAGITHVLSCEGWVEEAGVFASSGFLERIGGEILVVLYVRPQVPWINSAWWQWGAWSEAPFQRWLRHIKPAADWNARAETWKALPGVSRLEMRLAGSDIVGDFARLLDSGLEDPGLVNTSLDSAVLRLFQRNRRLRPGPHDSAIDFVLGERLASSDVPGAPWVIPQDLAEELVASYREGNLALERHLDAEAWQAMQADPRWWTAQAYGDRLVEAPGPLEGPASPEEDLAVRAIEALVASHHETLALQRRLSAAKKRS
jgi:hypothetical protein